RRRPPVRDPGGVRHRCGPAGVGDGRHVRHRGSGSAEDLGRRAGRVRPAAGGHHPPAGPAPADLSPHRGLRPLRAQRQGVHLGAHDEAGRGEAGPRPLTLVARVLPDIATLEKAFDYFVPDALADDVRIGTILRIPLHGRRVGGWVVGLPHDGVVDRELKPIAKVTGWGPPADVVDLAGWAAWRWAGRVTAFLRSASPPGAVRGL